ncbi:predicted protein [Lichtheimia corymbifera JMRC:FSU:9682]|uniref:Uncharacterized protein n=1 Tax=Lichtheimia corymbifera JMRC:FSU:9682 TaxID=1263082 RepID=A0A068SDH5_9FUNG|nr:predicted protein [Lichtheimia corymbifera JMRC:FSU:9682]
MKVYLFSLELSVSRPIALQDEDQHLALVDFSEASKRSLLGQFMAVVVKDTVSMVLQIIYRTCKASLYWWIFWAMFLMYWCRGVYHSQVPVWTHLLHTPSTQTHLHTHHHHDRL